MPTALDRVAPPPSRRPRPLFAWIATLFLTCLLAAPVSAVDPSPCPPEADARLRRCQAEQQERERLRAQIASTEAMVDDPEILLVKVEPEPGEGPLHYRRRVEGQGGVRTLGTGTFLPIRAHYRNPDTGDIYVALARRDFWRYVGEALGFASAEAAQVFRRREELSIREKRDRFLAPSGELDRLRADLRQRTAFAAACCTATSGAEGLPDPGAPPGGALPGLSRPRVWPTPGEAP
jgi:hypothetical protein